MGFDLKKLPMKHKLPYNAKSPCRAGPAYWRCRMDIRRVLPFLTAALVLLIPASALAQAWTPAKGELFLSLSYQYLDAGDHLFSETTQFGVDFGTKSVDFGQSQSQVLVLDGDIGITDRLTVNAAVAFVSARYLEGGDTTFGPINAEGPLDDGNWHSDFQNARVGVRYMAFNNGTWTLTPAVYYGFPATAYATFGHSALGRHLTELRLGLIWGRLLSFSGAPKAYLQGAYSYAFMEDTPVVSLDRSNLSLEFGYFLTDSLTLQAMTDYQNIHGGIDWARDLNPSDNNFEGLVFQHDATAASDFWRLGGGASFAVSERAELYGNINTTLWGKNLQEAITVTFGVSWGFQMFGSHDLGVWEQQDHDGPDADMDDWLLEDLEEEPDEESS